jgi:hypothetical protein
MSSRLSQALTEFAEGRWPGGDRDPRGSEPRFDPQGVDPRSMEPPLHPSERDRLESRRWWGARWIPVSFARFLVFFFVGVGTTLAWQSYGNAARRMVANLSPGLGWLAPPAAAAPGSSAATPAASPDQLAAISRSVAAVRQSIDKLAADVGKLQAAKPDPLARTSTPAVSPQPVAAGASGRRPAATAQVQPVQAQTR